MFINTDQANEVQAIEVQANDANEIQANNPQINADVSYEPTSYKTAYPVNDNKANGSVADKVAAHIADIAAKIDVNEDAPGLETKASNRKVSVALTKNRTRIEATVPTNIQPRFSTPVIRKGFTVPLSLDPVDRIGLNLRKVRTREKVQAWLYSDPEEQGLPITPEYNAAASTIEIDDPEASDLAPTPENNSVNDIAIAELAVNDDQADEQVQPKNQLITAVFRPLYFDPFS